MAIPAILPYPMPGASALPANKVNWMPDPQRAVLLIHDMQQYFVAPYTPDASPLNELLANIRLLHDRCEQLGIPVVYTAQPGAQTPEQRALLQDFWGPGIDGGPYQKQIIEALAPRANDLVLTKWRYSAFKKTTLLEELHSRGRDQLIVCGIYAHIGCLMTACDAFMQDIQPFLVADAVADFTEEHHHMALKYAADRCAVVLTTTRALDALGEGEDAAAAQTVGGGAVAETVKAQQASVSEARTGAAAHAAGAGAAPSGVAVAVQVEASAEQAAASLADATLTFESVRQQVAELLHEVPMHIADNDDLISRRGLDSIRIMTLVEKWRRQGIDVTFVELAEKPTLADWWRLLVARTRQALPNADYFAL